MIEKFLTSGFLKILSLAAAKNDIGADNVQFTSKIVHSAKGYTYRHIRNDSKIWVDKKSTVLL